MQKSKVCITGLAQIERYEAYEGVTPFNPESRPTSQTYLTRNVAYV